MLAIVAAYTSDYAVAALAALAATFTLVVALAAPAISRWLNPRKLE